MDNNELYHYGVPGMRWGTRRNKQNHVTTSKTKTKSRTGTTKVKPKLSKAKKIAIGSAAVGTGLLAIGAMLRTEVAQKRYNAFVLGKAIVDAM